MNELIKYTENKSFVRWVLKPDKTLDEYWGKYMENNPNEKAEIELARQIVLQLKSKKEDVSVIDTDNLLAEIKEGVNKQKNKRSLKISLVRYAAAASILIILGLGYFSSNKTSEFETNAQALLSQATVNSGKTNLVLFDGRKIVLSENESFVKQLSNGQFVVNQNDTVVQQGFGKSELNQIIVPNGKKSTVKFSDGTIVHLNAGSRLVYPVEFTNKTRQVFLEGEGFFEVSHNPNVPFIASTAAVNIEVLGTKFNISAYNSEEEVETFLLEGKIQLNEPGMLISRSGHILNPLQNAVYSKTKEEIVISDVNDAEYVSWYKGYLNFDSKNVSSVIKKVERHFNIKIELSDRKLGEKHISGKLKLQGEEIDTVVQVLANSASLSMEKQDNSTYLLK